MAESLNTATTTVVRLLSAASTAMVNSSFLDVDDDDNLYLQDGDGQSRWQVQMGLKYRF